MPAKLILCKFLIAIVSEMDSFTISLYDADISDTMIYPYKYKTTKSELTFYVKLDLK